MSPNLKDFLVAENWPIRLCRFADTYEKMNTIIKQIVLVNFKFFIFTRPSFHATVERQGRTTAVFLVLIKSKEPIQRN